MNFRNTVFSTSRGITSEFTPSGLPEIVLCGKSNVGKSTFINKLCGNNKLARIGSTPGKTVTINYYLCDKSVYLVDLPGYGYARRSAEEQVKWDNMIARYFDCPSENRIVFLLVDSRRGLTDEDYSLLDYVRGYGLPVRIFLTKTDKLSRSEFTAAMESIKSATVKYNPLSVCSVSANSTDDFRKITELINGFPG